MSYASFVSKLPSVAGPKTHLNFKQRIMWTAVILLLFLVMGQIMVYGIAPEAVANLGFLELILGSSMGTIMTLGIGPIVTASIILQMLAGSGMLPFDMHSEEGQATFQGTQKLLAIVFAIFEAFAFVSMGALRPASPELLPIVIFQVALGGIIVLFMDEVVSKWGIGSGISLFIAAGVSKTIFIGALNPLVPAGGIIAAGAIPAAIGYLQLGEVINAVISILPLIATILVFFIVVYAQDIKVEIPLAFGTIRGFSRRWPLKFIYTSNLPVILAAALIANLQLVGRAIPALATVNANGAITGGILYLISVPRGLPIQIFSLVTLIVVFAISFSAFYFKFRKSFTVAMLSPIIGIILGLIVTDMTVGLPLAFDFVRMMLYLVFFIAMCTMFSIFWVSTSGMDARSVANQIENVGLQIPGFRRDPRIVEAVLNRYIPVLAILGGIFVGLLAAVADFTNAIGTGTGILLTVMIVHQLYEQISRQYMEDMNPAVRRFFGGQ